MTVHDRLACSVSRCVECINKSYWYLLLQSTLFLLAVAEFFVSSYVSWLLLPRFHFWRYSDVVGCVDQSFHGGLRYVPFVLDVYHQDYKAYLDTGPSIGMPSNAMGKRFTMHASCSIPTWRLVWRYAGWLTGADVAQFCVAKALDMFICCSFFVKTSTVWGVAHW